jgi:large subunit ribosomal protein L9
MAKTEVILTHNVLGLGAESDHVKVAAGYARNYLFPQGLAIPLTAANKRRLEVLRQRRSERESKELTTMTELGQALSKLTLVIQVKTGEDGKLFGSVTAGTIADELKHQFDAMVDKRKIHLPHAIKNVGDHEVELRLHQQVQTTLKVRIESTTPLPPPPEAPSPEAREQGRGRGEGRREAGRGPAGVRREEPKAEGKVEGKSDRKPRAPKAEQA